MFVVTILHSSLFQILKSIVIRLPSLFFTVQSLMPSRYDTPQGRYRNIKMRKNYLKMLSIFAITYSIDKITIIN